jgi:5-methylcytosine-specific restriction protein A
MPARPKSICRAPGCGKVIDAPGHCDTHKKAVRKEQDERRGTAAERGYDNKWQKARVYYLRKHPLCVNCQLDNRLTAANVVDHIEPHRLKEAIDSGDKQRIARARYLFWDADNNWASLCDTCHNTVAQACERAGRPKPWAKRKPNH